MKRHMLLAGRSIMAAALTGAVLYLVAFATAHKPPIWPFFAFLAALIMGAGLYLAAQDRRSQDPSQTNGTAEGPAPTAPQAGADQPITGRWRPTTDGAEVPTLMRLTHNDMSHPAYMKRSSEGKSVTWVRIGIIVPCGLLDPARPTSEVRARFLTFLGGRQAGDFVNMLTSTGDAAWTAWDGHGRMNFGAVLGGSPDSAPVAWARLLLPETGTSSFGYDSEQAAFLLYVEPRTLEGKPALPVSIAVWRQRLIEALAMPAALTEFLGQELGLGCAGSSPAQIAIWLNTPRSLTELVDTEGIRALPGSPASNWFTGYAVTTPDGQLPDGLAYQWLRQMCDNMLHLDGYEPSLVAGNAEQASAQLLPMTRAGMTKLEHGQLPRTARKHQNGGDSYKKSYEQLAEKGLGALDSVGNEVSARSFVSQFGHQIKASAEEIPEFYTEEFYSIFKTQVVKKAQADIASCERALDEATAEAAAASTELTTRLNAAIAAGDQQAQHEIWRERELRQAQCQAKIDGTTARIGVIGVRIDTCNDLASALGISFN